MTEQRLKEMLSIATDDACEKKDEVYWAIKRGMDDTQRSRVRKQPTAWVAAVAAVAFVCFIGFTEPGRALAASIWSLFVPEKPVTVNVEGYPEEKAAILAPDSAERYAFYYDEAQFERRAHNGMDILFARDQDIKQPEVSLTIHRVENTSAQALYEDALTSESIALGAIDWPIVGYGMEIWHGQEWNDPVTVFYWLDDGFGNVYEFTLKGFVEAYEGHIQRMKQILTTFVAVQ